MGNDMKKDEEITEQQLNAFVDKELEASERDLVFNEAQKHSEIDRRLCEYRKLKELVRHAYSSVPSSDSVRSAENNVASDALLAEALIARRSKRRPPAITVWTSAIFLAAGCLLGVLFVHPLWIENSRGLSDNPAMLGKQLPAVVNSERIVMHLRSNTDSAMEATLARAEALLASRSNTHPVMVEVVTNGDGIDLLRSDLSPHADRISALASQNVIFIACAHRIEDLRERNQPVLLMAGVESRYTAFERVVSRLQEGWEYEKI